jgi:anti-sigma regulatory factor (Ser/Thr protein kinase)
MIFLELCIASRSEEISKVADAVESFGKANRIPRNVAHDMSVSLDEVLSNIISYACAVRTIRVRLAAADRQLIANVDDDGKPFNPLMAAPPDLSGSMKDRAIGGLGIHFVKTLMDHVAYVRCGDRNCLELKKSFDSI